MGSRLEFYDFNEMMTKIYDEMANLWQLQQQKLVLFFGSKNILRQIRHEYIIRYP